MSDRARLTEGCDECFLLGRTLEDAQRNRMDKAQWLAVVDMFYDTAPYGPETLQQLLERYQDRLGSFEPWRTWAVERWQTRCRQRPS